MNWAQKFALRYFINMNRRVATQDAEDNIQRLTWYMLPDRYNALFSEPFTGDPLTMAGRDVEEVVNDVSELDAYFDSIEKKKTMTGAEMFGLLDGPDEEGWI